MARLIVTLNQRNAPNLSFFLPFSHTTCSFPNIPIQIQNGTIIMYQETATSIRMDQDKASNLGRPPQNRPAEKRAFSPHDAGALVGTNPPATGPSASAWRVLGTPTGERDATNGHVDGFLAAFLQPCREGLVWKWKGNMFVAFFFLRAGVRGEGGFSHRLHLAGNRAFSVFSLSLGFVLAVFVWSERCGPGESAGGGSLLF